MTRLLEVLFIDLLCRGPSVLERLLDVFEYDFISFTTAQGDFDLS